MQAGAPQMGPPPVQGGGQPSGPAPANPQLATLPPTQTPRDLYDLGYGYFLRKDYALADQALGAFMQRYPNDRLAPEALYWLAEARFQRQQYREAAESFLDVTTRYSKAAKAPNALLRLAQSLKELGEKDAACASLGEIERKYPTASQAVKQNTQREQKRFGC